MIWDDSKEPVWTKELVRYLSDAPFPATKNDLIDYASRTGAPQQVIDNLLGLSSVEEYDEEIIYEDIEDIWPEFDMDYEFFKDEEEYS